MGGFGDLRSENVFKNPGVSTGSHSLYHGKVSGLFDPTLYLRSQAPAGPTLCCTPSESGVSIIEAFYPHINLVDRVRVHYSSSLFAAYSSSSSSTSQFSAPHEQKVQSLVDKLYLELWPSQMICVPELSPSMTRMPVISSPTSESSIPLSDSYLLFCLRHKNPRSHQPSSLQLTASLLPAQHLHSARNKPPTCLSSVAISDTCRGQIHGCNSIRQILYTVACSSSA